MAERSILFSDAMVTAIDEGRKTNTRRGLKLVGDLDRVFQMDDGTWHCTDSQGGHMSPVNVKFAVGDILSVRQTHYLFGHWEIVPDVLTKGGKTKWKFVADSKEVWFSPPHGFLKSRNKCDSTSSFWYKRLGRFMPRWASRITLKVTAVKVERLQDISEADAIAEGVDDTPRPGQSYISPFGGRAVINNYAALWKSINGPGSWDANPWVVACTFERIPTPQAKP